MFKSKHQFISNYSVVTGLYLSNTCLIFSDFTKTPQNGKVLKGSDFSLFQVKSKQLSQNRDIVNNFAPEWHSRGQRFDPAYLHQETWEPCEGKGFKSKDLGSFSFLLLQFVQYHIKLFLTCLTKCLTKSGVFKNVPHRLCGCPFALEVNMGVNIQRSRHFLMPKVLCNLLDRHTIIQQ